MNTRLFVAVACVGLLPFQLSAADAVSGPLHLNVNTNGLKTVTWPRLLVPALDVNQLRAGLQVTNLVPVAPNSITVGTNGYSFSTASSPGTLFFSLTQGQMSSNALLTANVRRLFRRPEPRRRSSTVRSCGG